MWPGNVGVCVSGGNISMCARVKMEYTHAHAHSFEWPQLHGTARRPHTTAIPFCTLSFSIIDPKVNLPVSKQLMEIIFIKNVQLFPIPYL